MVVIKLRMNQGKTNKLKIKWVVLKIVTQKQSITQSKDINKKEKYKRTHAVYNKNTVVIYAMLCIPYVLVLSRPLLHLLRPWKSTWVREPYNRLKWFYPEHCNENYQGKERLLVSCRKDSLKNQFFQAEGLFQIQSFGAAYKHAKIPENRLVAKCGNTSEKAKPNCK